MSWHCRIKHRFKVIYQPSFLRFLLIIFCFTGSFHTQAQTLGGEAAYTFLKLPASPLLSAAGGINASYNGQDVGLALNNPALLTEPLHAQIAVAFNTFFAAIKSYHLGGAYHYAKWNITVGGGIQFIDYGNIPQTNAAGTIEGRFHPTDYAVQLSGAKKYLEKWKYGITVKFINSDYQQYGSSALAFDAAVFYEDSSRLFGASVLLKNMGFQLKQYRSGEDLPFDFQIGITKRLKKAPFGFSCTAQQLHRFNLTYEDTTFNNENNFGSANSFVNNFFNHVVAAGHIFIGNNLEATIGYNRLRRTELNTGTAGNGLNGFSTGIKATFRKLDFQYARSYYGSNSTYNQIGLTVNLQQLFGLGKD